MDNSWCSSSILLLR